MLSMSCWSSSAATSLSSSRRWTACRSRSGCSTHRSTSSSRASRRSSWRSPRPISTTRNERCSGRHGRGSEDNPMLGIRGVRLGVVKGGLYKMQARAVRRRRWPGRARGHTRPLIMIPLVVTGAEIVLVRRWIDDELNAVLGPDRSGLEIPVGSMIETPRAAVRGDDVAEHADFFSFGTNDLTQMTFGFSRDDIEARLMPRYLDDGLLPGNPFETIDHRGVGELVRMGSPGVGPSSRALARGVRRARRRSGVDHVLLRHRPGLRVLLTVPGTGGPPGGGPGGAGSPPDRRLAILGWARRAGSSGLSRPGGRCLTRHEHRRSGEGADTARMVNVLLCKRALSPLASSWTSRCFRPTTLASRWLFCSSASWPILR